MSAPRTSTTHLLSTSSSEEAPVELDPLERLRQGEPVPEGERSLRGRRLVGEDLAGLDLSGWDLGEADLSRARLAGTRLVNAKLTDATFFEADLTGAEFLGATLDGANLAGAQLARAGFGQTSMVGCNLFGAQLDGAMLHGADLSRADLRSANLTGARLLEAKLLQADVQQANLSYCDLSGARVAGAIFDGALLDHATLRGLKGFEQARWLSVDLREIDFNGAYLLRAFIMDQNYLEEFRCSSAYHRVIHAIWSITSDCGRSVGRWTLWSLVFLLMYAWLFTLVNVDYGGHSTPLSPLYFSVVTFTTLGYGDVLPRSTAAQVVVMSEVITGYVMLGGLLSIFSSKMARRAD